MILQLEMTHFVRFNLVVLMNMFIARNVISVPLVHLIIQGTIQVVVILPVKRLSVVKITVY